MKLLLDTHIWLWVLLDPDRLSAAVRDALASPENELWLSPISVWEAMLLAERGRVRVSGPADEWVRQLRDKLPSREASLTSEIAVVSRTMQLSHQDPAHRFLAATARVLGLTLVTADQRLLTSAEYEVLPNI